VSKSAVEQFCWSGLAESLGVVAKVIYSLSTDPLSCFY
jgi:hypothetical protein